MPAVEQRKDPWTLRLGTWSCLGSGASYATWGKPRPPPDLSFPVCEVKLCTRLSSSLSRGLPCASGTPDSGLGGVQQDVGSRPRRAHVLKGPLGGWRGPSDLSMIPQGTSRSVQLSLALTLLSSPHRVSERPVCLALSSRMQT